MVRENVQDEIIAGLRVSLDIELKNDPNGMRNTLTLSSAVEELMEDRRILIQMPVYQGYHYPLPRDDVILMKFFIDSEMYAVKVRFEERVDLDGFVFAKVLRTGKVKPHQRRDCYRLPYSTPITVERMWINERELYPERQPTVGQMINFSDGGMLFATDENIEKGEKITVTFDLGTVETIEGLALRTERIEDGKFLFRVAVRFRNKDKAQKNRFYRYIVEKQLEELRRWNQDLNPLYAPKQESADTEQSNQ